MMGAREPDRERTNLGRDEGEDFIMGEGETGLRLGMGREGEERDKEEEEEMG